MDYGNSNTGDAPPNLIDKNKLNEIKIKRDSKSRVSDIVTDTLNPNLNSAIQKENAKIEDKKIVNNKPSQFEPILGVNFHNVKR